MVACADGRVSLSAAAHLHAAMALPKITNSKLQVRFCNGEFMGRKLTLQQRKQDFTNIIPNVRRKVRMSLIANIAAESKASWCNYFEILLNVFPRKNSSNSGIRN